MARERSKLSRLHQVHRWLQHRFPAPYKTSLTIVALDSCIADCERVGRKFKMRLSPNHQMDVMIAYLFHEYAHALSWPLARYELSEPQHTNEWGVEYATLYRTYRELGGDVESDLY